MGLDVYGYINVEKIDTTFDEDGDINEDYSFIAYSPIPEWESRMSNLEPNKYYDGESISAYVSYSYGVHNRFRESIVSLIGRDDLLRQEDIKPTTEQKNDLWYFPPKKGSINYDKLDLEPELPFFKFLSFSDCEGTLDWDTNLELYDYFNEYLDRALEYYDLIGDLYFKEKYLEWLEIFNSTKDNGVVVFR